MQKKIIALAVAAAFSSPAFADVGFYGIVDATVAHVSASGQKSDLIAVSGGASQSRLGVKATEDLGNGLTGVAVLEYGLDSQDSTTIGAARQKMIAVAGDFGTVASGYLQTASYDFLAKYDPIYGSGSSAHSIIASGHLVGSLGQRAQRAVAYLSPSFGGLTFAVNYATAFTGLGNLTKDNTTVGANSFEKDSAFLLSGNYAVDALSVGAVYASYSGGKTAAGVANANQTEFAFGGSYDLGVAKVMGTYQSMKSDAANAKANTVFSLAGVMPVSTGAIAVMYASNANENSSTATVSTSSVSATALTAGYLHTFTKSTTGYVVFSNVKNGANTRGYSVSSNVLGSLSALGALTTQSLGGSSTLIGVGLRKKF
ncbi:MAG: porin [Gallionella sp.]|nr:porin [Gallionella sp.]